MTVMYSDSNRHTVIHLYGLLFQVFNLQTEEIQVPGMECVKWLREIVQDDQNVCMHVMITVQKNTQKYFKQFQSLTMVT
jgi:hypothetical protein